MSDSPSPPPLGPGKQVGLVAAALAFAYGLVAPVAFWLSGVWGLQAAAVAAGVCLAGASAAVLVVRLLRGLAVPFYGVLAGMLPRMGIPLGAGIVLQVGGGPLADAGLLVYLCVFYPVAVAVETVIWVRSEVKGGRG